jgi:hypothetical protein
MARSKNLLAATKRQSTNPLNPQRSNPSKAEKQTRETDEKNTERKEMLTTEHVMVKGEHTVAWPMNKKRKGGGGGSERRRTSSVDEEGGKPISGSSTISLPFEYGNNSIAYGLRRVSLIVTNGLEANKEVSLEPSLPDPELVESG